MTSLYKSLFGIMLVQLVYTDPRLSILAARMPPRSRTILLNLFVKKLDTTFQDNGEMERDFGDLNAASGLKVMKNGMTETKKLCSCSAYVS